ncbi:MAG: hypothetical protein IJY92_05985 [Alphaproteobacteria bacterium]|nr:hypothetical protein [Alphaproteobacteria bacterium]
MKKELKLLGFVMLFFGVAFLGIIYSFYTSKKANELFDFLTLNTETYVKKEQEFPKKYYNHPLEVNFNQTDPKRTNQPDFVSITLHNISPLMCSQILRRERPFKVDVFLNNKPVFFGSDWRCFKGLNHSMRFQFELFNYTFYLGMNEPKACLDLWDCDVKYGEGCVEGYCQKTAP